MTEREGDRAAKLTGTVDRRRGIRGAGGVRRGAGRGAQLRGLLARMEEIEARLGVFLQRQRAEFPRGFLLSDAALLQLLSLEGRPAHMQPYLRLCFPGLAEAVVEAVAGHGDAFTAAVGRRGERLALSAPVLCGRGAAVAVVLRMHHVMRQSAAAALAALIQGGGPAAPPAPLAAAAAAVRACAQVEAAWDAGAGAAPGGPFGGLLAQWAEEAEGRVSQLRSAHTTAAGGGPGERRRLGRLVLEATWWRDAVRGLEESGEAAAGPPARPGAGASRGRRSCVSTGWGEGWWCGWGRWRRRTVATGSGPTGRGGPGPRRARWFGPC
jgi:hypothetical protein